MAVIFAEMGRSGEALNTLQEILPLQISARTAKHIHVKETEAWIARLKNDEKDEEFL